MTSCDGCGQNYGADCKWLGCEECEDWFCSDCWREENFEGDAAELAKHAKAFKHKCKDCKSHYSSGRDLTAHGMSVHAPKS
jgi:hypothetical protein